MTLSKIINNKYQKQAADLLDGALTGPIVGYHLDTSKNQNWEIAVVGKNHITIRDGPTGPYASVASGTVGAPVVGSREQYTWQQTSVPGGWFQIGTLDGKYIWYLTGGKDGDPIKLERSLYQGSDAQWGYVPSLVES